MIKQPRLLPVILLILMPLCFSSCSWINGIFGKDEKVGNFESKEELKQELIRVDRKIDSTWESMMIEDNRKIRDMGRLLDSIEQCKGYDSALFEKARNQQQRLRKERFTQQTLSDSLINHYDTLTNRVISNVKKLHKQVDNKINCRNCMDLLNSIKNKDDKVVIQRIHYDGYTIYYNKLLSDYEKMIEKLGEPFTSEEIRPIFMIQKPDY